MKKIYYLSTCSTCRRILKEINPDDSFEIQDLKTMPISQEQLEEIYQRSGSYLNIFNKQARKYRELNLHTKQLTEEEMHQLILDEYTFLKRPIFIIQDRMFVGNNKKVINELHAFLAVLKKRTERIKY